MCTCHILRQEKYHIRYYFYCVLKKYKIKYVQFLYILITRHNIFEKNVHYQFTLGLFRDTIYTNSNGLNKVKTCISERENSTQQANNRQYKICVDVKRDRPATIYFMIATKRENTTQRNLRWHMYEINALILTDSISTSKCILEHGCFCFPNLAKYCN